MHETSDLLQPITLGEKFLLILKIGILDIFKQDFP